MPPNDPQNNPKETEIDLDKILLPKKETPGTSSQSAERINAGALLAQEQAAQLPKPEKAPTPTPPPVKKEEETVVKPLQTFQGDIEKVVKGKNVSVLSIATAEADRRAQAPLTPAGPQHEVPSVFPLVKSASMIGGGVLLLAAAVALFAYLLVPPPAENNTIEPVTPFISIDETGSVTLENPLSRDALMRELTALRDTYGLSLGFMAEIQVALGSAEGPRELSVRELMQTMAPRTPEALLRTLKPEYLLGIHSYDGNQPFLLLSTDAYESAFAGLLEWEYTMRGELLPFFDRKPPIRTPVQPTLPATPVSTSTATSTSGATSTPTTTPQTVSTVIQTEFADRIIENHDARVIQNEYKDILFLWTFIDRQTILITTNDATVREVIRRLNEAPIIPIE